MTATTGIGRTPQDRQAAGRHRCTVAALLAPLAVLIALPAAAAEITVEQKDRAFVPSAVTIKAGDTLVFTNGDPFVHNMFSNTPGAEFNLGGQGTGEAKSVVLRRPGTVDVECQIHPRMHLRVEVK